jgi:hypothetical protein
MSNFFFIYCPKILKLIIVRIYIIYLQNCVFESGFLRFFSEDLLKSSRTINIMRYTCIISISSEQLIVKQAVPDLGQMRPCAS